MKKLPTLLLAISIVFLAYSVAHDTHQHHEMSASDDRFCEECAMSLGDHKSSNHKIVLKDSVIEVCSLHCAYDAIIRLSLRDMILYGFDNEGDDFKPLDSLFYVVASSQKSAMTSESEFAFGSREKAQDFVQKYGGRIIAGSDMLAYEKDKFAKDNERISAARAKMIERGENIAKEYCDTRALQNIHAKNIAILKKEAKQHCENIDSGALHAVATYLWNTQNTH